MKFFKILIFSFLTIFFVTSKAASEDPMIMLRSLADNMMASLKRERSNLKKDPKVLYKLVDRILVPHVDLYGISRSVLGREAYLSATASQQKAFNTEFTHVVVDTYAAALNAYTDEKINFFPIRGGYAGLTDIEVQSEIIREDGPPIPVTYNLKVMNGKWKIYDFSVEGVGLTQSFKAQFEEELSKGKTVAQITSDLRKRNIGVQ